jgi:hypothetical protein
LPANELPLWRAWQYIEPFGWSAQNHASAKVTRMIYSASGASGDIPPLSDFMSKDPDWRAFDPDLHEEMEADRLMRNLKSVMRGAPDAE